MMWLLRGEVLLLLLILAFQVEGGKRDFSDADIERLYQEWEDNDDEGEAEDRVRQSQHDHPGPDDLDQMLKNGNFDPQDLLKQSKKNKPVMIFVGVDGAPDRAHTNQVSSLWVQSLQNAHIHVERYVVADDRVLLLVNDGSLAWKIKDYLVTLTDCTTVSFDQLKFDCNNNKKEDL